MKRSALLSATLLAIAGSGRARSAASPQPPPRLDLYQWMATASNVVDAMVLDEDRSGPQIRVTESIRGTLAPGAVLVVDVRTANRDREEGRAALKLTRLQSGLFLLAAGPRKPGDKPPVYALVRGIESFRALPEEGRAAWIEASHRLADLQDTHDDPRIWHELEGMLEDPNPVLVDTSLALFWRFGRGDERLLPVIRPLLAHPRVDFRSRAAELAAAVVSRRRPGSAPEIDAVLADLTARSRRDPETEVRAAATRALRAFPRDRAIETLKQIAADDPEQAVRYEAERILYEWSSETPRRSD